MPPGGTGWSTYFSCAAWEGENVCCHSCGEIPQLAREVSEWTTHQRIDVWSFQRGADAGLTKAQAIEKFPAYLQQAVDLGKRITIGLDWTPGPAPGARGLLVGAQPQRVETERGYWSPVARIRVQGVEGEGLAIYLDPDWPRFLEILRPYWPWIDLLEIADEPGWSAEDLRGIVAALHAEVDRAGLQRKPVMVNWFHGQLMGAAPWQEVDVVGFEAYVDPAIKSASAARADVRRQLDEQYARVAPKPVWIVFEGYTRNGKVDPALVANVIDESYAWQRERIHEGRIAYVVPFSYCRPTGMRDRDEDPAGHMLAQVRRGVLWALTGMDPGPVAPPPAPLPLKATCVEVSCVYPRWYPGPRTPGLTINGGDGFHRASDGFVLGSHRATCTALACGANGLCYGPNEGSWAWGDPSASWTYGIAGPGDKSGLIKVTWPRGVCTIETEGYVPFRIEAQVCQQGGGSSTIVADLEALGSKVGVVFALGSLSAAVSLGEVTQGEPIPARDVVCAANGDWGPDMGAGARDPFDRAVRWPCGRQCGQPRAGCAP